jgi:cell division protein FtsL
MSNGSGSDVAESKIIISFSVITAAVLIAAAMIGLFGPQNTAVFLIMSIAFAAIVLSCAIAILTVLSRIAEKTTQIGQILSQADKIERILEKSKSEVTDINRNTRLSETAKRIAFRESDRQTLREAVYEKLQQKDFDTANEIIDEIAHSKIYLELVKQLRKEAEKYRNASEEERINQVINHINKMLDNKQWAKASIQIEKLISAAPDSEKAKAMRQKLHDKKEEHKRKLLQMWDESVKKQETDRSLEILKELDAYLTPNEGLALQEAAKDVFRNKLHNLGVRFSIAVTSKQWQLALETAREIIQEFPNSKMASEIREKIDVLRERAEKA